MSTTSKGPRLRVFAGGARATPKPAGIASADATDLARVAAGEVGALGGVYDRHSATVLGFAGRAVGASDAEDVLQMTFVRAARIAGAFDATRGTARSWLIGIAARIVMERRRSFFRQARAFLGLETVNAGRLVHAPDGERLDVVAALHALSPEKRVVVLLAEVEGFKCEEIAQMLGIPIGTVWTRLHHARRRLRASLEGYGA